MILIVSHKEDYTTDYIVNKLNYKGIKYLRLNTEDIGAIHNITLTYSPSLMSVIDGYSSFKSVWFRRIKLPSVQMDNKFELDFYYRDFKSFLDSFWQTLKVERWLSLPVNIYKAENKLYQLSIAERIGFSIPNTLISTEKSNIIEFYNKFKGEVILKPLSRGRYSDEDGEKLIFTNKLKKEHLEYSDFSFFPILFQEQIKKEYEIRVTVVGEKVFSAKVDSQSNENTRIDWRKDHQSFTSYQLPQEIEKKCVEITKLLGLSFGAIDFIKTADDYIFLEINPNGQWVWIETETGLKISDEIIYFLTQNRQ